MIWRTCGSDEELVGAQRVLDACRRVRRACRDQAEVLRRIGVVAQLAKPASELGGGAEGRHPVAADQPRDRRVVDAGLLRQLALRHLLGLELGSKPFVERSAVLGGHAAWALLDGSRDGPTGRSVPRCDDDGSGEDGPVSPVGTGGGDARHPSDGVECGAVGRRSGRDVARRSPRTKVRPRRVVLWPDAAGSAGVTGAYRLARRESDLSRHAQAAVGACGRFVSIGWGMRPRPRGFGETT